MSKSTLPALPFVNLGDAAANRWAQAVTERLEVREGSRGDPLERVVTFRDMEAAGITLNNRPYVSRPGEYAIDVGNGLSAAVDVAKFAEAIRATPLYHDLMSRIDDPTRFDKSAAEIKAILLRRITDEAAARGTAINRSEVMISDLDRSLAATVKEITAQIENSRSGIRELQEVYVTELSASALQVTQLEARIDSTPIDPDKIVATEYATLAALTAAVTEPVLGNYYKVTNPTVEVPALPVLLYRWDGAAWFEAGKGQTSYLEETLSVSADRVTGLESKYAVKVNANGVMAGFGLAATANEAGEGTSAFLIQADKFALLSSSDELGTASGQIDPALPPVTRVPFGIDTVTGKVYINGQVLINAGGQTLDDITTPSGLYVSFDTQFFKYNKAGTVVNSTLTLTANLTGALAEITPQAYVTWTCSGGYSGTMPTAGTTNTLTVSASNMTADAASFTATYVNGATTYADVVTVLRLYDGSEALTGTLTNGAYLAPASSAGVVSSWAGASGTFQVYRGSTLLATPDVSFAITSNPSTLTATINSTTGAYSVTGAGSWADATNVTTLTFTATVGANTIRKDFVLTKVKQGAAGTPASWVTYVFKESAVQVTPTGTNPLPTGWLDAPPGTYTNPIWMSKALVDAVTGLAGAWSTGVKVTGVNGTPGIDGDYVVYQYAKNTSTTTSPTTGWQNTPTTLTSGEYQWMRAGTVVPPLTSPSSWGAGYRVSGEKGDVGDPGDPGVNAKTLVLSGDSYTFKRTSAGAITPSNAVIKLTAAKQNTANAVSWGTSPALTLYTAATGGSATTTGDIVYLRAADFGANTSATVTASIAADSLTDTTTITTVRDGTAGLTLELGNPTHQLPTTTAGVVTYTGSGTTIMLYEGATACTITAVTGTGTNITSGLVSSGLNTTTVTMAQHSAILAATASVKYTVTYTKTDGTSGTAYVTQTLAKQVQGDTGVAGTRGTRQLYATSALYVSGYASYAADATTLIASATSGSTPTTPIKGDTVTFTNGTNYTYTLTHNGTGWVTPGVVIDGSLLVTGSVTASKVVADSAWLNSNITIGANGTLSGGGGGKVVLGEGGLGYIGALNADVTSTALNEGTTITGGGITLSSGGSIKGGQTAYGTGAGFYLGYSGAAYKFSVGKAATPVTTSTTSTNTINLTNHGYAAGDAIMFSTGAGAIAAGVAYVVYSVPSADTFTLGVYDSITNGGAIVQHTFLSGLAPVIAATNILWDGNSLEINGEHQIGTGVLATSGISTERWLLNKGRLTGISSGNKKFAELEVTSTDGSLALRSESSTGIPLTIKRTASSTSPTVWIESANTSVEAVSVTTASGVATRAYTSSATYPAIEAVNGNAAGIGVRSDGIINVLKGGVQFPANFANSANANTLDDYEEYTWTPTISGASFTNLNGTYTKIGNVVTFSMSASGSAAGANGFTFALPFASSKHFSASVMINNITVGTNMGGWMCWADSGGSIANVDYLNTSTGLVSTVSAARIKSGTDLRISGSYFTTG